MDIKHYTYLAALAGVLILAVLITIRVNSISLKKLKYMIPAIVITGALLAYFGIRLSQPGIKTFNSGFLCGGAMLGLPVEELIYLIVFPILIFAVYEWIKSKNIHTGYYNYYIVLSLIVLVVLIIGAYLGRKDIYTLMVFLFSAIFFGYVFFRNLLRDKYPSFFIAFVLLFAAWFLFDWLITGLGIVVFNPEYISGTRLLTVPIEEMAGFFLLMLMNISVFEYLSERKFINYHS